MGGARDIEKSDPALLGAALLPRQTDCRYVHAFVRHYGLDGVFTGDRPPKVVVSLPRRQLELRRVPIHYTQPPVHVFRSVLHPRRIRSPPPHQRTLRPIIQPLRQPQPDLLALRGVARFHECAREDGTMEVMDALRLAFEELRGHFVGLLLGPPRDEDVVLGLVDGLLHYDLGRAVRRVDVDELVRKGLGHGVDDDDGGGFNELGVEEDVPHGALSIVSQGYPEPLVVVLVVGYLGTFERIDSAYEWDVLDGGVNDVLKIREPLYAWVRQRSGLWQRERRSVVQYSGALLRELKVGMNT